MTVMQIVNPVIDGYFRILRIIAEKIAVARTYILSACRDIGSDNFQGRISLP